jgi:enoyl-[acyl-carrier protein] reductase I
MTKTTPLKGLVVGVANDQSIAWGCAKVFSEQGSDLAITYANEKMKPHIEPLAQSIGAEIFLPLDVADDAQMDAVFAAIEKKWGKLDFVLHSVAFAPKGDLHGRVVDSSAEGFKTAMDISCHSLIRMCKRAEPLMKDGGAILTMSYYGAEKVVDNYNMMGPVKAALEASVRYLAKELGVSGIRVNALSPGPVMTRAASGLSHFDNLIEKSAKNSPLHDIVSIEQIGEAASFLVSPKALHITGQTIYVDNGYNTLG